MKAIFFNLPAYGHVNPSLAIVKGLIEEGEEVIYYTSQNFEATLTTLGATYRPYPIDLQFDFAHLSLNVLELACEIMDKTLQLMPDLLEEIAELKPDYILHDTTCIWAKIAAQQLQIPAISTIPFSLLLGGAPKNVLLKPILQTIWKGLPYIPTFFSFSKKINQQYGLHIQRMKEVYFNDEAFNIVYTSKLLQRNSEKAAANFAFVGPSISERKIENDFPLAQLACQKVVYISLGTVISGQQAFYQLCFDAFRTLDALIVLDVGNDTDISKLQAIPDNFIIRHPTPQLEVLKKSDVFITHAGMNSLQEGIYYEVPLVMIPRTLETTINAVRAEEVGAGIYLPCKKVDVHTLRQTVQKILLQNPYKKSLNTLKNSFITSGGAKRAVQMILQYVDEQTLDS